MRTLKQCSGVLVISLLLICSLAAGQESPPPANTMCPVLTDQAIDKTIFTDYQGKRVYFCCEMCKRKFTADPAKYAASLTPAAAGGVAAAEDDAQKAAPASTTDRLIRFLGKFHPMVVHFPIALILSAFLAELLAWLCRSRFFADAARFCLWLAVPTIIVAIFLGWADALAEKFSDEEALIFTLHRLFALSACVLLLVSALAKELTQRKPEAAGLLIGYRIALLLTAIAVGLTGHMGATLVYGLDYFTW